MQNDSQFQVFNASAGSGKTFTLVKEYLKIVLSTDDIYIFQNILAITFTNKAAAEMKERILENLREFSEGVENDMSIIIRKDISISKIDLHRLDRQSLKTVLTPKFR